MYSYANLSPKQQAILDFIIEENCQKGFSPTYREIAGHFGYRSPKAATDHVRALEKKGFLRCHGRLSRGIELLISRKESFSVSIPVLGDISAGKPLMQTENKIGELTIDPAILGISTGHRLFALTANGDSMIDRAIFDGDWVIADADIQPKESDIVVALIDGENTLKTLAKTKDSYFLKSENPIYKDFFPLDEMIIQGVVKAVIRRL